MVRIFQSILWGLVLWLFSSFFGQGSVWAQIQDFESPFQIVSIPDSFLEKWYGNEVRTSSRIFQANGVGRNGSKGLAVQPISTFDGEIWVELVPQEENSSVLFYAWSLQNGTGNRPAVVFYGWSETLGGEVTEESVLGSETQFPNQDSGFKKFRLDVPEFAQHLKSFFLRIRVSYGAGSGSAARWVMDDFFFGVLEEDGSPPEVIKVRGFDSNQLQLIFNERVDPVFSQIPMAYSLDGLEPDQIIAQNDSTVIMEFETTFLEEGNYSLTIRQIPDLEGNFIQDTTLSFQFEDPTAYAYKSLVINELMPAPKQDLDLPNVEYVELFNPSTKTWRLDPLQFSNSRSSTSIPPFWLEPGKFLILCPKGNSTLLEEYGEVLELTNWPTMLNSGDQLQLTENGLIVDQISYQSSTWGGSEFSQGGYSLEVPFPDFGCESSELLAPSQHPQRGTPGFENSLFGKIEPPLLTEVTAYFISPKSIRIRFDAPLPEGLSQMNVEFSPFQNVLEIQKINSREIELELSSDIQTGQVNQLNLINFSDCFGNFVESLGPITLVRGDQPKVGELVLNELLFDPKPGDPKFVEIANLTDRYLNLEGWALANLDGQGMPAQIRIFGFPGQVIAPKSFLAITSDPDALRFSYPRSAQGNFQKIPSLPSYPISGGTVLLLSDQQEEMDRLDYSEDLHHPLIQDSRGVSLERIDMGIFSSEGKEWTSAASTEDFATPGRKNSQSFDQDTEAKWLSVSPEVFDPEGFQGVSFTTFSYQLPDSGWIGSLKIYSSSGRLIDQIASNQLLGSQGSFVWYGTGAGNKRLPPGYYVAVFELFDLRGRTHAVKKTVVIASKL